MPITVDKLKQYAEDNSRKGSASAAMWPFAESLEAQQADWNKAAAEAVSATLRADAARMRAEAEARQAAIDTHTRSLRHGEELQRLRTESEAAARKYFWKGVAATILISIPLTLLGWLLSALNADQVLSHLLSHLPHP